MLKIERKLIDFLDKHICLLCMLLVTALGLWLRRLAIWWNYDNVAAYFDMHAHSPQGATYYLLVFLLQYLPKLPLHSVKWLAGLSDIGVAILMASMLGKNAAPTKKLIFYVVSLFSPVLFLRGITLGQLDSMAILFLLLGYALYEKYWNVCRLPMRGIIVFFTAFSIALYPCLLFAVFFFLLQQKKSQQAFWCELLALLAGIGLLQSISVLVLKLPWTEGIYSLFHYLTYHPETGELYQNAGEWLLYMGIQWGAAASMLSLLAAGRHKISYAWAIGIQITASVLCGEFLFKA